jgi:cysteine desulfurase
VTRLPSWYHLIVGKLTGLIENNPHEPFQMSHDFLYLDNNASTAPLSEVLTAVTEGMSTWGNPASAHDAGRLAAEQIERARESVSGLVGARPGQVVFTSGATEANNLALRGLWEASRMTVPERTQIVVGATEHPAVLEVADWLAKAGAEVVIVPVDRSGLIDLNVLEDAVSDKTLLVSVMAANNETGVVAPVNAVVQIAHAVGAYVHSDATQMVGRLPLSFVDLELDLLSLSGHKMHGPKGVGALIASRRAPIAPQVLGGGHERGIRSGTLNTPGIVGLGVAAELADASPATSAEVEALRDRLVARLAEALGDVEVNGAAAPRLPNTANLQFAGAEAEAVMANMPEVACSSGSACSSAIPRPSHVLLAMGLTHEEASQSLRFSLSRFTTAGEVDEAVARTSAAVENVRHLTGWRG